MFNWREVASSLRPPEPAGGPAPGPGGQPCPTLARAIAQALRKNKPEVLDLGPLCGDTVVSLASRGARVTVEEFDLPRAAAEEAAPGKPAPRPSVRIDQPDGKFDLVLAWDQLDFVPPDRLHELAREIRRVTAAGGQLLFFSRSIGATGLDRRGRYRIVDQDRIVREPASETPRSRWVHPTRMIEQALAGFSIQGIHLQRDQTREFLAVNGGGVHVAARQPASVGKGSRRADRKRTPAVSRRKGSTVPARARTGA